MINDLHIYVQKVLPLVYDDSLSYYELLNKVVKKINEVIGVTNDISGTIKTEVSSILTTWLSDGTLEDIIGTTLDNLGDDIDDLDTRLTAAEGTISGHTNSIGALEDDVDEINSALASNTLSGVRCLLIGNSYAAGTGGTSGRGWPYYFEQATGADCEIIHQNGGDFVAAGNQNASYPGVTASAALTAYAATLTTAQKSAFKYVIYGGGYNDHNYVSSVRSAVTAFVSAARTAFPNAKVIIIPMYPGAKVSSSDLYIYGQYIAAGALDAGAVTTFNAFTWLYGRGFTNSDNTHPTDSGYQILGRYAAALVQGWDGIYEPVFGAGVEYESDVSSVGFRYTRGRETVSFTGALRIAESVGSVPRKLATLPDLFLPYTSTYFPVFLYSETLAERSIGVCYLNSEGLFLANANNTFPDGVYIYFGTSISYFA